MFQNPLKKNILRHYSTQSARSKVYTKGMLKEMQKQELYSLRSIIDPRIPGINDKAIRNLFSPIVTIFRKWFGIMKLKKEVGFFEETSKLSLIQKEFLEKIQRIYECTNINNEKSICTPSGYDNLKTKINDVIKTKRTFTGTNYSYISTANIAFANIPKSNTAFIQITSCIQLPNGSQDYVVFERDLKSDTGVWRFAGWVDPSRVYRKASMAELLGTGKEQSI